MNVTYEHKPEMTLIGFSTSIRPEEGYIKCPQFWEEECEAAEIVSTMMITGII